MTIVNDDSRVITKLETSLTDDARVVIYNCHMFKVQATDGATLLQITVPKWKSSDNSIWGRISNLLMGP
jgi:hypothetical protein